VKPGLSHYGKQTEGVRERVLRKISGAKKEEVTKDWTALHNKELHDLYCS
jgi:hypothetical protein